MPCAKKSPHSSVESQLLANQELWSAESKRSSSYEPNLEHHYYDKFYWCEKCDVACVFTAHEQKEVFEVQKRSIYTIRRLCSKCHKESKLAP